MWCLQLGTQGHTRGVGVPCLDLGVTVPESTLKPSSHPAQSSRVPLRDGEVVLEKSPDGPVWT